MLLGFLLYISLCRFGLAEDMHLSLLHSIGTLRQFLHMPLFSSDKLKLAADCFKLHRTGNKSKTKKVDSEDATLYNEAVLNCSILFDFPEFEHTPEEVQTSGFSYESEEHELNDSIESAVSD